MLFVFSLILGAFSYPPCPSEARVSPVATGMELSYGFSPTLRRHSLAVKMDAPGILTTCAACAAPLAHDAPRCVRCKLRYCNATCQQMVAREAVMAAAIADLRVYKAEIAANEAKIAANEAVLRALETSPPDGA